MPQPEFHAGRLGETDEPRSAEPEAATGFAVEQCRAWLNWAAAQVDASLASDSLASAQLLAALADALGPGQPQSGSAPASADSVSVKMSAVIIAVQSHDRVMQGLTHVAESLRALHAQLGDARRADSAESWRMLRETQYRAFSMAQERALFARMVADEDESTRAAETDPEETVELFAIDPGPDRP
jgi:hypothetical protein